ncbi:hypothetical protein Tco_0075706 [Tanacetum coccineum]
MENTKTSQATEITELKERVKKLEKKGGSRTYNLKRLHKERKIADINADVEVTLVDETQGRYGDNLMFDTGVLDNEKVFVEQDMAEKEVDMAEKDVSTADLVTTTGELVITVGVEVSTVSPTETTTMDELTLNEENIISSYYCLYTFSVAGTKVNAADIKVTTAERLQLLEEFLLSKG